MNKKAILIGFLFLTMLASAFAIGTAPDTADVETYFSFDVDETNDVGTRTLTMSGTPAYDPGILSNAYTTTTSADYGLFNTDLFGGKSTFTLSTWINMDSTAAVNPITTNWLGGTAGYMVRVQAGGDLNIYMESNTVTYTTGDINTNLVAGTDYYITVDYDGSTVNVYVDNVLVDTGAIGGTFLKTGTGSKCFGCYGTNYFDGQIDEFYLFDSVLTADERAFMYQGGSPTTEQQYPFTPPVTSPDTLTVQVKDADTLASLNNVTVSWDGTNYSNVTGSVVSINITAEGGNANLTQNFTVYSENYFSQSATNWNISSNYVANLTQYAYIAAYDVYSESTINTFNATIDATEYQTTNGFIYVPYNSSKTVLIEASNYFSNTTTHNFLNQANLNESLKQSEIYFNVSEIITNATASGTITIGSDTKDSDEVWYLSTGSYAATFTGTGYFDADLVFNVTALDNITQNITVSGSIINITATQAYTDAVIEDFTVSWDGTNITYTGTAVASGASYAIPALTGYGYNVTVSKDGFITKSTVYTTPTNLTNADFTLYATNHIEITFYDEETRSVINDVNYTLTSSDFGFSGSTTDGTATFIDLETDRFNIAYSAINYTDRNHIFNIPSTIDSQTNRSLYLILDTTADDFVLTVQNKLGQTVEGLTASLLRQYVVDNQTVYEVVEMMSPSVALDGATRFTAEPNYVPYLFRVQDSQQNILFQGSGTTSNNFDTLFLIDSQISIRVDTGTSPFELSEQVDGFQYSLSNSTTRFWFSYDDTALAFESYGIEVYANGTNYIGDATGTSSDAILSVYYTYDNQTSYRAFAYGVDPATGTRVAIDSIVMEAQTKPGVEIFGILSWFILFLSLIVFTIGLASNLTVAILFDILAIMAFSSSFIGIIAISLPVQSGLFIAGLVVVYLMRDK